MPGKEITGYEDMIGLPRHVSAAHQPMPRQARAAQFSPFAALSGYEDCIAEEARLTQRRPEPDEETKELLNFRLGLLARHAKEHPEVTITHFVPDEKKAGGAYCTAHGNIRRVDEADRIVVLTGGEKIRMENVIAVSGPLLDGQDR